MKQLQKEFIGIGEVKGFLFRQICDKKWGFIYEVTVGNGKHYEVFEKRENTRFGIVSYPKSKSFGKWAWSTKSLDKAKNILSKIESNYEN